MTNLPPQPRLKTLLAAAAAALLPLAATAAAVNPPPDLATWACTGHCGGIGANGDITASPLGNLRHGYVTTSDSSAFGVSPLQLDANSRGAGTEQNGSRLLSGSFQAQAGDRLDVFFNFVSTDGKGYDDYAWARLVDAGSGAGVAWLFTARSSNSSTGKIVPGDVLKKKEFDPDEKIVGFDNFEFHSKSTDDPVDWAPLGASNGACWKDNADGCGYTGWLNSRHAFAASGHYRLEVGVVNWGDSAYDSGLAFDFAHLSAPVPEPATVALLMAGLAAVGGAARRQRRA